MEINETNISMIRGDSETITVYCEDNNGAKVNFETGDTIYLTVKQSVNSERKILQKIITEFVNGEAIIEIFPEDTKDFSFRAYVYDIQLTRADGTVTTIIPPSDFVIEGEVTCQ